MLFRLGLRSQVKAHGYAFSDAVQPKFRFVLTHPRQLPRRLNDGESATAVEGRVERDPGKGAQRQCRISGLPRPPHGGFHQGPPQPGTGSSGVDGKLLQVRAAANFLQPDEGNRWLPGNQHFPGRGQLLRVGGPGEGKVTADLGPSEKQGVRRRLHLRKQYQVRRPGVADPRHSRPFPQRRPGPGKP